MKVLVTGGAGFLGSHVADAFSRAGHEVVVFDIRPSPWLRRDQTEIVGDLLDNECVESALDGVDCVFHLAALADLNDAKTRPVDSVRLNILGTVQLLEAMRKLEIKQLLFSSTVYVYSREGSFYRCSKQACEAYIEEYQRRYGIDYTILRYGSLYGPRADTTNGVYRWLRQAMLEGTVTHSGGPEDLREYIHVHDAARLSVDAAGSDYRNTHLVITGTTPYRIRDLFTMFEEMLGRDVSVDYLHHRGGHYKVTPYAFTPKVGHKLTANPHVDMGQGLLQVMEQLHDEQGSDR
jgi:UDP-glucose 4-epimerase